MIISSLLSSLAIATSSLATAQKFSFPSAWEVSDLHMYNTRHGTLGTWEFNIHDTSSLESQTFNTTCHYTSSSYVFAIDGVPIDQPCNDPDVTFSLYPTGELFQLNVTHLWGNCGSSDGGDGPCNDNGTWTFSRDDVRGQQSDVRNNFGQYGGFARDLINMYPLRAVPAESCCA